MDILYDKSEIFTIGICKPDNPALTLSALVVLVVAVILIVLLVFVVAIVLVVLLVFVVAVILVILIVLIVAHGFKPPFKMQG